LDPQPRVTFDDPDAGDTLASDGRKCLFIASEVRCGSTYIAESLSYELNDAFGFELWDVAREHFSDLSDGAGPAEALTKWRSLFYDRSGFVGSKFMCKTLSYLHRLAKVSPAVREAFFGRNAYWIIVRRQDRLEQAVSLALAKKTGAFHHYGDPELAADRYARVTLAEMDAALKSVAVSDAYLHTFAASLAEDRRISLFYREFLEDEVKCLNMIHRLCGFPERGPGAYANKSKLRRTGQREKREATRQFREWFLCNHA
jgi:LPS sulfotransferase NodH